MKTELLTILYILTTSIISAQNQDNTLGPAESDDLDPEFGQFIMEMPFGAKLYKTNEQPGIHIYVDDSMESEVAQSFSKGGFPNYLLINAKGEYKPKAIDRLSGNMDIKAILDFNNK